MLCLPCRIGRPVVATSLICALLTAAISLHADDAPPAEPPAEQEPADPFALPEGSDSVSVGTFVQNMVRNFSTRGAELRTEDGTKDYLNRMDKALAELQGRKLEEEPATLVASVRMQALNVLVQLRDPTSQQRLTAVIDMLKQSESQALKNLAAHFELQTQISQLDTLEPARRKEVVAMIAAKLREKPISRDTVQLAQSAADTLQNVGEPHEAVAAYEAFIASIKSHNDERLGGLIESMEGAARFAGLMGNPMEVKGTTVDGQSFDINQYKGKVVLVDFWATWCGPCIGELPNVKQNYELYHGKGFEVVGISLDDDPERLHEFLQEEEIPWVTLFPTDETQRGWENPIARHYGISGIPSVILINQEGNVVNLNARGPALGQALAQLLGPAPLPPGEAPAPPSN